MNIQKTDVQGNVAIERGDFIGRDKVVQGNAIYGDSIVHNYPEQTSFPKALSAKVPRIAPEKIVGRENDLADLRERLCDERQVVLVNGMGGIGKTTLAQGYVAKHWNEYQHVVWISQISDDVLTDFVYTEGLLSNLGIQADGQEVQDLFIQIMTALKTVAEQPNLLVIDNAESELSDFYAYLPAQPKWHILITSRQYLEKFDIKELDFLSEEAAIDLFLRHYTRGKISHEEVKSLVNFVDLHTLTIEILAKTAQTQRTEIHRLEQAIADNLRANVYVPHKGQKIDRVTSYLCSIFTLSGLTAKELWLLKQFTCLPAEFHRYEQLYALIKPEASQKEAVFAETMAALTDTGWLLNNQVDDSYKMHRIISDVIAKQYDIVVTDVEPLIECVTDQLSIDQSRDNPIDKFPWIPFGQAILAVFPKSDTATIATLQNNLALVLKDMGDYAGAKELLEVALLSAQTNFGPDHPTTAVRSSNLATVLQALGDYAGAKELLEVALLSDQTNFGPDHPNTARSSSNLALVLQALGDYAGAKEFLEVALNILENSLGPSHPNTEIVRNNLASIELR